MDSPVRKMDLEETADDEYVLVPDAADLMIRSYHLVDDDDKDDADHEARFLAGNNGKTIDADYFASEPSVEAAAHCKRATACSGAKSEDSVENDVIEAVEGLVVTGAGEEEGRIKDGGEEEGDHHGWQRHAVGVLCSVGIAAAATGLALLLGGNHQQQPPHKVHFTTASGGRKMQAAKVSARRDARMERQGVSVPPRGELAPASVSFGGSSHGMRF